MATALALLPEKKEVESWRSQQNWDHRLRYGNAICAIRLAEQTIDDYQLAPGPNFAGSGSMLRIGTATSDRPIARSRWLCWR